MRNSTQNYPLKMNKVFHAKISPSTPPRIDDKCSNFQDYGDRFIPNRKNMDLKISQDLYSRFKNSEHDESKNQKSSPQKLHESILSDVVFGDSIHGLNFFQFNNGFNERSINSSILNQSQLESKTNSNKSKRLISNEPSRVLSAPELIENKKFNLLDWNDANQITVGLNGEVWIMNIFNEEVTEIHGVNEHEPSSSSSSPSSSSSSEIIVTNVAWSPDSRYLAITYSNFWIKIFDSSLQLVRVLHYEEETDVTCISWRGNELSIGGKNGCIYTHDFRIRKPVSKFPVHVNEVNTLKWSTCGSFMASSGQDKSVLVSDSRQAFCSSAHSRNFNRRESRNGSMGHLHTLVGHDDAVQAFSWCPFKKDVLASGGGMNDCKIKFWNVQNGQFLNDINCKYEVLGLEWSKHCNDIFSFHEGMHKNMTVWNYNTLSNVCEFDQMNSKVLYHAINPYGDTVVTAGDRELLTFWDVYKTTNGGKERRKGKKESANGRFCSSIDYAI